jgi:uncharacterized membrane protein
MERHGQRGRWRRLTSWVWLVIAVPLFVRCGGGGPATGPHFFLSVRTPSVTVAQGGQATLVLSIERVGNFAAPVQLSIDGLPDGVEAAFSPNPVPSDQTSVVLTLRAAFQTTTGTYSLTIRAQGNGIQREARIQLTVGEASPNFNIQLSESTVGVVRGGSASLQVLLTRIGSFSEPVALALEGAPAGVTAEFSPNPFSGSQTTSTLTLRANADASPGTFTLTVVASSGTTRRTAQFTLTITESPDFSLSVEPSSLAIQQGASGSATVRLMRVGGFNESVMLSLQGAPAGISASFTPANLAPGQDSAALTLQVASQTTPGTYTLTIVGTASVTRTVRLTLEVRVQPDFLLALNPSSVSIAQGGSTTVRVMVSAVGDFNEVVNLSISDLPAGVNASFNPPSIRPGEESLLTLQVGPQVPQGTSTATIRGTAGSLSRSATLSLQVLVSFQNTIQPIFTQRCAFSGCHDSRTRIANLDLSAGNAYAHLVNVPSAQDPRWTRVVPGDPARSLLYRKVSEDNPPVGSRMPLGGRLTDEQITLIRLWIEQGARNN